MSDARGFTDWTYAVVGVAAGGAAGIHESKNLGDAGVISETTSAQVEVGGLEYVLPSLVTDVVDDSVLPEMIHLYIPENGHMHGKWRAKEEYR